MRRLASPHRDPKGKGQTGALLLETIFALILIAICASGLLGLVVTAMKTTENQGHLMARTTEYAQDKMEQLVALAYCDASSDTTKFPTVSSGGTGLAGCPSPTLSVPSGTGIGGNSDPNHPATGYVDYLNETGSPLPMVNGAEPTDWYYTRVWQISAGPGGVTQMKQVTVTVKVRQSIGERSVLQPQSSITVLKTVPF